MSIHPEGVEQFTGNPGNTHFSRGALQNTAQSDPLIKSQMHGDLNPVLSIFYADDPLETATRLATPKEPAERALLEAHIAAHMKGDIE
jgi:hypothetical protein